jgi:hypothetical protein
VRTRAATWAPRWPEVAPDAPEALHARVVGAVLSVNDPPREGSPRVTVLLGLDGVVPGYRYALVEGRAEIVHDDGSVTTGFVVTVISPTYVSDRGSTGELSVRVEVSSEDARALRRGAAYLDLHGRRDVAERAVMGTLGLSDARTLAVAGAVGAIVFGWRSAVTRATPSGWCCRARVCREAG